MFLFFCDWGARLDWSLRKYFREQRAKKNGDSIKNNGYIWRYNNNIRLIRVYLLRLRSDGSRLNEPLDIMAAIEKSVPFFDAAATAAAAAAVALQWFDAPSSMIPFGLFFTVSGVHSTHTFYLNCLDENLQMRTHFFFRMLVLLHIKTRITQKSVSWKFFCIWLCHFIAIFRSTKQDRRFWS